MSFDFNTHKFTSQLRNVKPAGHNKWIASCTCSENHKNRDKKQSLSIGYDPYTENLLVKCHAGCDTDSVCAAVGCTTADLITRQNTNSLMKSVSWYCKKNDLSLGDIYPYGDGLFKVRFYDRDGDKTFRWVHKDDNNRFGYTWSHEGYSPRLFVSGDLSNGLVILTEGEKDAITANNLTGMTAVSTENGATKKEAGSKWHNEYTEQLSGKDVYILFDNDDAGRNFANIEAAELVGKAKSVYMLDLCTVWSECPEKGDISDMAESLGDDGTKERLQQLFATAEPVADIEAIKGLIVKTAVEQPVMEPGKKQENTSETVPPLEIFDADFFNNTDIPEPVAIIDQILYPGLGLLGSPAKMGKSYMMLQLAVSVATGEKFLGFDIIRPGSVLYLDLQGTPARTQKRLKSLGYDAMPQGVSLSYKARNTDGGFIQQIEHWLSSAENPSLVIVDMMQQIKGGQRRTEDAYQADNRILEPLHDIALKHDISVLGVMHTRKGNARFKPDDPFDEIIGSIGQFGSADCAWMILGKRDDDKKQISVICRDNDDGQQDYEAEFKNHRWSITGTIEELKEVRETDAYNNNPVVFTIRKLVKESGGGWYGTMSDLMQEVLILTNEYPAASPKKMSMIINNFAYRLSCEGIEIDYPGRNGGANGRRYKFYRKTPQQTKADI